MGVVLDDAPQVPCEFRDARRCSGCAAARQRCSKSEGVDEAFGDESESLVGMDEMLLDEMKTSTKFEADPTRFGRSRAF